MSPPLMITGPSRYFRAVVGSFDCPRYTTSLSWSAWNEQSFVARSSGVGQVTGVEAYAGFVGSMISITARCSRRAV